MERKLIAAAVSSALAVPMAAQAVEFAASGHVNRAVIVVDQDGLDKDGDLQHVDANSSGSRFRFKGSEELDSGLTAGVNMELGVKSTGDSSGTSTRHAAVYLNGAGGKLTLGHTSTAADGMAHARLGGPSWLGGVSNWCAYHSAGPACPSNDGGRTDILRYDTPSLGPVGIAASTGDNEYWDAKLTVAGSMGEAGYDFRLGYIAEDDNDDGKVLTTSAAVSFGQGTAIAAAWSKDDMPNVANKEHEYFYAEADHSYGDGSVGVYWKRGETSDSGPGADVEGTLWGIGLGHNIGGGATAYAGFRHIEEDDKEDINLYLAGMRVTFN